MNSSNSSLSNSFGVLGLLVVAFVDFLKTKLIALILVFVLIGLLGGCGLNDQDKYVKMLRVGEILDVKKIEDAEVIMTNGKMTKYFYCLWYSHIAGNYTQYFITTTPENKIIAIWSK
jgi:hypothetical protein